VEGRGKIKKNLRQDTDRLRAGRYSGRNSSPGRIKNFLHVVLDNAYRGVKLTIHLQLM
jgi:hypothetical protein